MLPLARGESAGLDDLFAAAVFDGEAQRAAAGTRREKHVMRRAVAEVKDALPVAAAAPIDPRGESERVAVPNVGRQRDDGVRAVEHQRLAADPVCVGGAAGGDAVIAVARGIQGVRLETEFCEAARAVGLQRLHVADRGLLIAISDARRGKHTVGRHRADILDPVVERITLHPRRAVQHVDHRGDCGLLLRVGGIAATCPIRAIVPFGYPNRAFGGVVNALERIIHLVGRTVGISGVVAPVIVHRHKVHAEIRSVRLCHERIQPTAVAAVRGGRRTDAQSRTEQIRPRPDGVAHRDVRLVGVVRLVVAKQLARAARLPVLRQARPPTLLANRHILQVARGILVNIPIIPPFHIQLADARIARDALLARPAPGHHINEPHAVVEVIRQDAHLHVAVLRHIILAEARAAFGLRERRHVTALELERADLRIHRAEAALVVGVLAERHGRAGKVRSAVHRQWLERRRVRHDDRAHGVFDHPTIAVRHRRRAAHAYLAEVRGHDDRRLNTRQDEIRIHRVEIDGATG